LISDFYNVENIVLKIIAFFSASLLNIPLLLPVPIKVPIVSNVSDKLNAKIVLPDEQIGKKHRRNASKK